MNLACPHSMWTPDFNVVESVVWSVALIAPLGAFLALPKLLPLRRELTWSRIKMMWPLGWLAVRDPRQSEAWRRRMAAAWRRDVLDTHGEGTRRGEVVRDERLLGRARLAGWTTGGLVLGVVLLSGATMLVAGDDPMRGRIALALAFTGLVAGWLARVGGAGAALWTESLALGRSLAGRIAVGALAGAAYGAVAAFSVAFVALLVLVPLANLMMAEPLAARDLMVVLTAGGVSASVLGALVGPLLMVPLAVGATRR